MQEENSVPNKKSSLLQNIFFGLGLLASVLTFGSLAGGFHWMLDLLSHFHLQYIILLLIALLVLIFGINRRLRMVPLVAALLVNLYLVVPFFFGEPATVLSADGDRTPLRVMSMNISTSNAGYPKVVALIREREPDIIFLSEVRDDLVTLLSSELGELYPVQHTVPSRQTLGLAILAKDPAVSVQTLNSDVSSGRMRRRYLQADFVWDGVPVTLAGIHPLPPMRGEWAYGRDREISVMGELAQETDGAFILAGDLNASPWSLAMRALVRETDLRYATDGYGIWPTWHLAQNYVGPLLGAPLDHILLSPEWDVLSYTESGDIGSDHVPLQVDLALAPTE